MVITKTPFRRKRQHKMLFTASKFEDEKKEFMKQTNRKLWR